MEIPLKVSFRHMRDAVPADFQIIAKNDELTARDLPQRIFEQLNKMAEDDGAYQIDRFEHVLQAASRCERDGADDDWVIGALLHDLGDLIAPFSHGEVAAEILRPFVRDEVVWTVRHHSIFQMFYNPTLTIEKRLTREQFKDHIFYQSTVDFCEHWDQVSFDPEYEGFPAEHFLALIERIFTRKPFTF